MQPDATGCLDRMQFFGKARHYKVPFGHKPFGHNRVMKTNNSAQGVEEPLRAVGTQVAEVGTSAFTAGN